VAVRSEGDFGFDPQVFGLNTADELVLHLCFANQVLLEVVHAESGQPVTDVRLLRILNYEFGAPPLHPGLELSGERSLGASPVLLPAEGAGAAEQEWWFVGAPGAAWRVARIDRARGGRQRVELGAGADLYIEMQGSSLIPELYLLLSGGSVPGLRQQTGSLELAMPLDGVPQRLSGLPVGRLDASLQSGPWHAPFRLVDRQGMELLPGRVHRLHFDLEALQSSTKAWVRGHLIIDNSVDSQVPHLEAYPVGPGETSIHINGVGADGGRRIADLFADGPGRYAFGVHLDAPGTYVLALPHNGFAHWIDVPAEGLAGLLLEPPSPLDLEVVCLNALSGQAVPISILMCRAVQEYEGGSSSVALPLKPEGQGRFRLECPPAQLEFTAIEPHHDLVDSRVEVGPSDKRIELRFQTNAGVRLVPRLPDGKPGPGWLFEHMSSFGLVPLEGQGSSYGTSLGVGEVTLTHAQGGRFRVRLPEMPSYEVPDNLEVVLIPGQVIDLVVELVPHE
jgi:hypothetical protein